GVGAPNRRERGEVRPAGERRRLGEYLFAFATAGADVHQVDVPAVSLGEFAELGSLGLVVTGADKIGRRVVERVVRDAVVVVRRHVVDVGVLDRIEAIPRALLQRVGDVARADGDVEVALTDLVRDKRNVGGVEEAASLDNVRRRIGTPGGPQGGNHAARDQLRSGFAVMDIEAPQSPADVPDVHAVRHAVAV